MDWQCPLCGEPLKLVEKQWCCENKHVFDRAKEGYVNLQPVQFKKSKVPGDSKQMVNARREFLSRGHYEPLALKLSSTLETLNIHSSITLHDLGCGEGYYLATIAEQLSNAGFSVNASGNDIAKIAIQKAAKKYQAHNFCVASMPFCFVEQVGMDGVNLKIIHRDLFGFRICGSEFRNSDTFYTTDSKMS